MNYEQSLLIDQLYARFKKLNCEKTFLFIEEERKLHNTDLKYSTEEFINDFIRERHNNLLKLEHQEDE